MKNKLIVFFFIVSIISLNTKAQYEEAGLIDINIDFKKMSPVTCIYISGQKK